MENAGRRLVHNAEILVISAAPRKVAGQIMTRPSRPSISSMTSETRSRSAATRRRAHSISSSLEARHLPQPPPRITQCHCYSINFLAIRGSRWSNIRPVAGISHHTGSANSSLTFPAAVASRLRGKARSLVSLSACDLIATTFESYLRLRPAVLTCPRVYVPSGYSGS